MVFAYQQLRSVENFRRKYIGGKDKTMKVAIPIWEWRVSPVFDTAKQISIADIEKGEIASQFVIHLQEKFLPRRAGFLLRWRIEILICGGISAYLARQVAAQGIRVVPGIKGNVDEVLKAFCRGNIPSSQYVMPGWRGWRRKRYQRGRYDF